MNVAPGHHLELMASGGQVRDFPTGEAPSRKRREMLQCRTLESTGGTATVELRGALVHSERLEDVREFLEEHYVNDGVVQIRLRMEGVEQIDLEGAASLATLKAEALRRGKGLTVEGAAGFVRAKLRTTGLLAYLEEP
jgi:anti-anti-sigma regulatory factor